MLLQQLDRYADRLSLPPRLYSEQPVRYIIELDGEGGLLSPELTDTADPASPSTRRGKRRLTPSVARTVAVRPFVLTDKADYVLGYAEEGGKPERIAQCHAAYLELLRRCAGCTGEPAVAAVLRFLAHAPLPKLRLPEGFDPGALIAFRVDGVIPTDLPAVQAFWADENEQAQSSAPTITCMICGVQRPVLERLELKVKGVPGGQTAGTSIVSFNAEAFESYGLRASLNAPTCASCGERFTIAVNHLLASEAHSLRLNNVAYVFWTREPVEDLPFGPLLGQADPEQVKALLESVFKGKEGGARSFEGKENRFYATALSGSGGRAVVREWIDTSVREAREHVARWFLLQRLVDATGTELGRPLALRQLAYATVRTGDRANPPAVNVSRALLRTALTGNPLPAELLYEAVRRNRAEQRVTRPRAALIKMVLLSQQLQFEEDEMTQLNPDHPSAAYHCGRLLAVLEQAQRAAIPGVNATIVDRFYGAASSAPCSVLPTLLRGARAHLDKLERDRPGAYIALERRLDGIVARIPELPATLSLADQGRFALGYYHQRAADRAAAREAAERRKAGVAVPEAELADVIEPQLTTQEEED